MGTSSSPTDSTTPDAFDDFDTTGGDVITKLTPWLDQILYSSQFHAALAWDLATDPQGAAYIVGQQFGDLYSVNPGAFQTEVLGNGDAFMAKFDFLPWVDLGQGLAGFGGSVPMLSSKPTLLAALWKRGEVYEPLRQASRQESLLPKLRADLDDLAFSSGRRGSTSARGVVVVAGGPGRSGGTRRRGWRTERMKRTLVGLLAAALALAGEARGQEAGPPHPLPKVMRSRFSRHHAMADAMWVPGGEPRDSSRVGFAFSNGGYGDGAAVEINWDHTPAPVVQGCRRPTLPTGFLPTALCKRSGVNTTFYVVGWDEDGGTIIVESWTFVDGGRMSEVVEASSGRTVSHFTPPEVRREVLWRSDPDHVGPRSPIWSAACQVKANQLWLLDGSMLEPGDETRIWILDLTPGARQPMHLRSTSSPPDLAAPKGHRLIVAGLHPTGGLILYTQARRPWDGRLRPRKPYLVCYFIDEDLDGLIDGTGTMPYTDFHARFPTPWLQTW